MYIFLCVLWKPFMDPIIIVQLKKALPQLYDSILGDKMKQMSKSGTGKNVKQKIPKRVYEGVYGKHNECILFNV